MIVNVAYMLWVTFLIDPIKQNYSMITYTLKGYIIVFILCILLSINISNSTYIHNRKYLCIAVLGPIIGCIFPFKENAGNLLSNIHEICAYISFISVNVITYLNITKYKLINSKKGNILFWVYLWALLIDVLFFLSINGVRGFEETLLLSVIVAINYLISNEKL